MQKISILGATGSIGKSTVDVIQRHPDKFQVVALTTHSRIKELVNIARSLKPETLVVADEKHYEALVSLVADAGLTCEVAAGADALVEVSSRDDVDTVMAAIVGGAGLMPTLAAVKAGKKVLLANKEALVMSGELFMNAVKASGATLLPIDSEHNAIFQCLPGTYSYGQPTQSGISKILLTGSGGPFRTTPIEALSDVTPDQACAHPNWNMGRKISVDSATMMNKGLEFVEACWLFGVSGEDIQVVLHPQSMIHSMVQYADGSVLAQMGNPDMRTPIAHCLAYPERITSGVEPMDFSAMIDFTFSLPDMNRYPNLQLAMDACDAGQWATTSLNAANEVSVSAFLAGDIAFTDIAWVNSRVLERSTSDPAASLEDIIAIDAKARGIALQCVSERKL